MKLPRELIIGDSVWKVMFIRDIAPVDRWGKAILGFCDEANEVIEIKTGLDPFERLRTFIHEVLHCFECEYPDVIIPHELVDKLEIPIARLILDNFVA